MSEEERAKFENQFKQPAAPAGAGGAPGGAKKGADDKKKK
jgi:hypothetical protein